MLVEVDEIAELKAKILESIVKENYQPHQKLLSEKKLAAAFNSTQNRVHRALQRLINEGHLYSKPKGGTFIAEKLSEPVKSALPVQSGQPTETSSTFESSIDFANLPRYKTLKIMVPVGGDPLQVQLWEQVLNSFVDQFPFLKIAVEYSTGQETDLDNYDLIIKSPHDIHDQNEWYSPLEDIFSEDELYQRYQLAPKLMEIGKSQGKLCGIPILRTTGVISVNNNLARKHNIDLNMVKKPVDLMKTGDIIENSTGETAYGVRYLGFYYHAAMYGIVISRENERFIFDREKIKRFMIENKPWIKKHHFKDHKETSIIDFQQGRYLLFPHFINDCQVDKFDEEEFRMISFPTEPDGFVCEGAFLACLNRTSKNLDEAVLVIRHLVSKPSQEQFVNSTPPFLSIRTDVLNEQKAKSPFPSGAINYDFDLRSFYTQLDPVIFWEYGDKINTEMGKYFMELQDLDKTLENLEYL